MKDSIIKFATYNGIDSIKDSEHGLNGADGDLGNSIITILNGVIGIIAAVCVVIIVIGGVQYMTSSGDAGKVKKAKDTILYAIIGLVVCALAATIVNFVISKVV